MKIRLTIKHSCGHRAAHTFTGPAAPEWEQFVRGPEAARIALFICPACQLQEAKVETDCLTAFRRSGQIMLRNDFAPKLVGKDSKRFKFVAVLAWQTSTGPQYFNAPVAKRVRVGSRPGPLCVVAACVKVGDE